MAAMKRAVAFIFFALFLGAIPRANAEPSYITFPADIKWQTQSSDHFHTLFRAGHEKVSERVLAYAEEAFKKLTPIFPEAPPKTWIIMADFQDSTNGYGLDFPWPHMVLFLSPPNAAGQLSAMDDWVGSLILHEYVHILQMYPAKGFWGPMRAVFGSWVVPNGLMPSHFHEGIATFLETELTRGGRGRGAYFSMLKRMAVEEGKWNLTDAPLDLLDGSDVRWPHGTSPYFYGYQFFQELWRQKGAKGITALNNSYASNLPYFLNTPLREHYGADVDTIWQKIFERAIPETRKEIDEIKKSSLSDIKQITDTRYFKGGLLRSPDGKVVAFQSATPRQSSSWQLLEVATGKILKEIDIENSAGVGSCWASRDGKEFILYGRQTTSDGYSLNSLAQFNVDTESVDELLYEDGTKLTHIHELHCDRTGSRLVVYREANTIGEMQDFVRGAPSEKKFREVRKWRIPTGAWATSILVTDETTWFLLREGLNTALYRWDKETPVQVMRFKANAYALEAAPASAKNEFYVIADIDGRNEIWKLSTQNKTATKVVALLGGANSYVPVAEGFVVSSYRHGGYDLGLAPAKTFRQVSLRDDGSRLPDPVPVKVTAAKNYSAFSTITPTGWIPMGFFVPNGLQMGAWIPHFDVSQKHIYDLFFGYDTRGFPYGDLSYQYRISAPVNFGLSGYYSPTYFFGTTTPAIQPNWGATLSLYGKIPEYNPTLRLSLLFRRNEPFVYEGTTVSEHQGAGVGVAFSVRKWFKQDVVDISPYRGTRFSVEHNQFFQEVGSTRPYYMTLFSVDQYVGLPWGRHVLYAGLRAGITEGTDAFNSYFLWGGELLFSQSRGTFNNRGYLPQRFRAQKLVNLNLEYRFPLVRVDRGFWIWPVFLDHLSGAVVVDSTTYTRDSNDPAVTRFFYPAIHPSIGVELKSQWKFGYYMPAEIRIGVYHGFPPLGEPIYATLGVSASL